jgi:metal-responsive CopG/Arc/MetJ family transcriptional regulator
MVKKISVDLKRIKERANTKSVLFNIRMDKDLYDSFKKLCDKEIKLSASEVIRAVMEDLCEQHGYLKK